MKVIVIVLTSGSQAIVHIKHENVHYFVEVAGIFEELTGTMPDQVCKPAALSSSSACSLLSSPANVLLMVAFLSMMTV